MTTMYAKTIRGVVELNILQQGDGVVKFTGFDTEGGESLGFTTSDTEDYLRVYVPKVQQALTMFNSAEEIEEEDERLRICRLIEDMVQWGGERNVISLEQAKQIAEILQIK